MIEYDPTFLRFNKRKRPLTKVEKEREIQLMATTNWMINEWKRLDRNLTYLGFFRVSEKTIAYSLELKEEFEFNELELNNRFKLGRLSKDVLYVSHCMISGSFCSVKVLSPVSDNEIRHYVTSIQPKVKEKFYKKFGWNFSPFSFELPPGVDFLDKIVTSVGEETELPLGFDGTEEGDDILRDMDRVSKLARCMNHYVNCMMKGFSQRKEIQRDVHKDLQDSSSKLIEENVPVQHYFNVIDNKSSAIQKMNFKINLIAKFISANADN